VGAEMAVSRADICIPGGGWNSSEVGEYFQDEALVFGLLQVESDLVGQQSIFQRALS